MITFYETESILRCYIIGSKEEGVVD